MGQAVATVLVLILVLAYAVFFTLWNQDVVDVVSLRFGSNAYVQSMPVAFLPLLGLVVGALIMALTLWAPWAAMKRAAAAARDQLRLEKQKANERAKKVNALSNQVKELKAHLATATKGIQAAAPDSESDQA